jgi:hypothetical protein
MAAMGWYNWSSAGIRLSRSRHNFWATFSLTIVSKKWDEEKKDSAEVSVK